MLRKYKKDLSTILRNLKGAQKNNNHLNSFILLVYDSVYEVEFIINLIVKINFIEIYDLYEFF